MDETTRDELEGQGWDIEVYHRGIKQCCRTRTGTEGSSTEESLPLCTASISTFRGAQVANRDQLVSGETINYSGGDTALNLIQGYPAYSLGPSA